MRVNMDSSVATEPRYKLLGREIGKDWKQAVGSIFLVWLACYERRSICLSVAEADIAAEQDGFAHALVRTGFADLEQGGEHIVVHGVEQRIRFLLEQQEKGAKGGKISGKSRRGGGEPNGQAGREADGSRAAQAYSPDHTTTPSPAPDHMLNLDFEQLYRLYPRKQGKKRGLEAAPRVIRSPEDFEAALGCVQVMAARWAGHDTVYCPQFDTFIRQERWRDETPPLPSSPNDSKKGNGKHGRVEPTPHDHFMASPVEETF